MDRLLLVLLLTGLVACSPAVHKPVIQAAIRPPNISDTAAVAEMASFLSTQGYEFKSVATKKGLPPEQSPTIRTYSNGTGPLVEINDDSLDKCFTLLVLVESNVIDDSSAMSIGQAFIDHFRRTPGWTASTDDGCNVGL
jgi:hypothetical protein